MTRSAVPTHQAYTKGMIRIRAHTLQGLSIMSADRHTHRTEATAAPREVLVSVINVPQQLRNPHPLVAATRRFYEGVRPDEDGRMRPGPKEGVAHLIVSRATLGRALRVLEAI